MGRSGINSPERGVKCCPDFVVVVVVVVVVVAVVVGC